MFSGLLIDVCNALFDLYIGYVCPYNEPLTPKHYRFCLVSVSQPRRRSVLGQSPKVDDLFFRLHNRCATQRILARAAAGRDGDADADSCCRVQEEVQVQRRLLQMQGSLELLMAAASR
jgi:hypothetical protein